MNPEMMMYMMQNPQASHEGAPEEIGSPFNAGALAAIKSAKHSLGMDEEEKRRAAGLAIAKFFSGMAKPGYGEGFAGALGAAASNVAPALEAYQGEENRVAGLNSALMKQQTDYELQQQKMKQQAAEHFVQQAHREAKQQEIERHHRALEKKNDDLLSLKRAKASQGMAEPVILGGKEYSPITSKSERARFVKDKQNFGSALHILKDVEKEYNEFRELTKDNAIDPQAPYYLGTTANLVNDFLGEVKGDEKQKAITAKRQTVKANLGRLVVNLERVLKGSNLGEAILKRFEKNGLFPTLDDRPEVFKSKLNALIKELSINYQAASDSLRTGLIISPMDIEEAQEPSPQEGTTDTKITSEDSKETKKAALDKQISEIEALLRQGTNVPKQGAMIP